MERADPGAGPLRRAASFAMANKVYWVLPLVLVSLLLTGILATSSSDTRAAPSLYTVH